MNVHEFIIKYQFEKAPKGTPPANDDGFEQVGNYYNLPPSLQSTLPYFAVDHRAHGGFILLKDAEGVFWISAREWGKEVARMAFAYTNSDGTYTVGAPVASSKPLTAALKAERERRGLSQREVGELMGLATPGAQGAIARWETGAREPSASNLAAWAAALGLTLEIVPKK